MCLKKNLLLEYIKNSQKSIKIRDLRGKNGQKFEQSSQKRRYMDGR